MTWPAPDEIEAFEFDQREGIGDKTWRTENVTSDFWGRVLAPAQPEYAPAGGQAYRASNRDRGLPGAMSEAWVAANGVGNGPIHRDGIYSNEAPKQLADYAGQPKASLALPKQGESDQGYVKRFDSTVRPNLAEIPADLVEAATVAYNAARERLDSGTAREDTRRSGDGVGLFGEGPASRSLQGAASYRDLAANASQSAHEVMAAARQAEEAQRVTSATLSRSGYIPLAGEAAATVRQTTRQYAGNQGLFR